MQLPSEEAKNHNEFLNDGKGRSFYKVQQLLEENLNFSFSDFSSLESFVQLLHQPRDPSSLAFLRILYGFLMIVDVFEERGLSSADRRWGDSLDCRFPYLSFLKPLSLEWMCVIYFFMIIGATGIILGWRFRMSCVCFIILYWYILLMDKSYWNNHSYLFGLLSMHLLLSGADRCWSIDGRRKLWLRNTDVPLWNYILVRGQVFLVYFIAGLKKMNEDWLKGYSMLDLGVHWVFGGFRFFLDDDQITYFVVHLGGFLLDLTVGFFMLFNFSRPYAYASCLTFNLMNSRMFAIGVFPYMMIAVMPIFSDAAWPKKILQRCPKLLQGVTLYEDNTEKNAMCVYNKNMQSHKEKNGIKKKTTAYLEGAEGWQKRTAVFLCIYFSVQVFLPYSHWLTKGYNTWTSGPYGYSWDMMVHRWNPLHTTVSVVEKSTGKQYFINPESWIKTRRWLNHAHMVKQYAHCVEKRLKDEYNITNIEIFMDVWISLNSRFAQRVYDPTIDILAAEWSPFHEVTWVLPLQTDLSDWRHTIYDIEETIFKKSDLMNVIFITDFPGLQLINYVNKDIINTTLQVLKGQVEVELFPEHLVHLEEGQSLQIPSGQFHRVAPRRHKRACYMYSYLNKTEMDLEMDRNDSHSLNTCNCSILRNVLKIVSR